MRIKILFLFFFLVFLFFFSSSLQAAVDCPLIVEVQISAEKSSDDFIKIYNPGNSDIYLNNYQGSYLRLVKRTQSSSKDYTIKSWSRDPEAKIPAGGFFLWANKNYTALPNVDAFTSQTISANNGIALRLGPENTGAIIDALGFGDFKNILFEGTPFPENPGPNQKLERKQNNGIYQDTDNNSQDFYLNPPSKLSKTETLEESQPQPKAEEPTEVGPLSIKPISYPAGIILNEILPSPTGSDETEEWIEIFNQNNFKVELSGWKIKDTAGKITTYTFSKETKISAQGFLVLRRPETKITLNNDGDGLNLIWPNGKIIDSLTFGKAPQGQSYNRIRNQWVWSDNLTPGAQNVALAEVTEAQREETEQTVKAPEKGLSAISEPFRQKQNLKSLFPFLIALGIAIFSGIIILILKKKLKQGRSI